MEIYFYYILIFFISVIFSWRLSRLKPGSVLFISDSQTSRSLHTGTISRSGGLAILFALMVSLVVYEGIYKNILLQLIPLLALISYIDDRGHIRAIYRLAIHIIISALFVIMSLSLSAMVSLNEYIWSIGYATTIRIIVLSILLSWAINLYNFMDGMDGFAGGMAVIGFGFMSVLLLMSNNYQNMYLAVGVALSVLGFLIYNFPPARIFMGDTGSTVIGFMMGVIIFVGTESGVPVYLGILVFSPFIVDATVTLLSRIMRHERVWKPHRSHYYQRLVLLGWGHRKTVLSQYFLMFLCGISSVSAMTLHVWAQYYIIIMWIIIYIGLAIAIHKLERNSRQVS